VKALVKTQQGPGHLELLDVEEPSCGPGQAKVEVKASGICGTDIHILNDVYPYRAPVILGHEYSGTVVETGPGVQSAKVGDRVAVLTSIGECCGTCRFCRDGHFSLCIAKLCHGEQLDGGFAKYSVVREELATPLPDNVSFDVGALTEPLACCVQAVERADIKPRDVVLVSGPGPIGLLVASLAKLQGAKVVVCGLSRDARRLQVAKEMGADIALAVDQGDLISLVKDETDGYGADVVFETAGVEASVKQCLNALAVGGTYVQIALFGEPAISVNANMFVNKHVRLLGNYGMTWESWGRTLKILSGSGVDFSKVITARMPLSAWEAAFEAVQHKTALKVLLYPE